MASFSKRQDKNMVSLVGQSWGLNVPAIRLGSPLLNAETTFADVHDTGRVHLATANRDGSFDIVAVRLTNQIDTES